MKYAIGSIWERYDKGSYIVVPTNIGWTGSGHNVMGRGVAHQASQRFPELSYRYGQICKALKAETPIQISADLRLILFPVKPLNVKQPHLSWQNNASLELIEKSLIELSKWAEDNTSIMIALPLVGCGNGKLARTSVIPTLERHLSDAFTLVELKNAQ